MEIQVSRAGGKPFMVYPKMFMNDRTRQMMVNPDIQSSPFQDLYVSPIEFDPGQPRLQLAKGQSGRIGDVEVRFVQFDLQVDGNALVAMQQRAAGDHRRRAGDHQGRADRQRDSRSTGSTPAAARSSPRPSRSPAAAPSRLRASTPAPAPCSSRPTGVAQPGEAVDRRHPQAADPARLGRPLRHADRRRPDDDPALPADAGAGGDRGGAGFRERRSSGGVLPFEASPPGPLSTKWRGGKTTFQGPLPLDIAPSLSTPWRGTEGEASEGRPSQPPRTPWTELLPYAPTASRSARLLGRPALRMRRWASPIG